MWKEDLHKVAERIEAGYIVLKENTDYFLAMPESAGLSLTGKWFITQCGQTSTYRLNFRNCLGIFDLAGIRIKVESPKINDEQFFGLLTEVSAYAANLPFSCTGGKGFFRATALSGRTVLYQTFIYLYSLLQAGEIQGAVHQITDNPYLQYEKEWTLHRVEEARGGGDETLRQMALKPQYLLKLPGGSGLKGKALGHKLGGRFPEKVWTGNLQRYADNPENRFIKYVLILCRELTASLEAKTRDSQIREKVAWARREIDRLLKLQFFQQISRLTRIPFSSQVLQKRESYKELFIIFSRLNRLVEVLNGPHWQRMLELKDAAELYEYWTFIRICKVVETILGKPLHALTMKTGDFRAKLPYGLEVIFPGGVKVFYNRTYHLGNTYNRSYSVTLRPDIVVQVGEEFFVFDAKFKLDRLDLHALADEAEENVNLTSGTTFRKEDLYKMHTYRDALRGCRGAYILYPGSETRLFPADGDDELYGVGAIGMRIREASGELEEVVRKMLR